jgi:hypothetical protein
MPWTTRREGDKVCIYKEGRDGKPVGKRISCHDSQEEADGRIRELGYFAHKSLGEAMKAGNVANLAQHISETCTEDPGLFRCCMAHDSLADYDEETRGAICARVHYELTGMWPGEHRQEEKSFEDKVLAFKAGDTLYIAKNLEEVGEFVQLDRSLAQAITGQPKDRRLMLIVSSNAYIDREGEIVRQDAWEQYVEKSWRGAQFINPTPHKFWHAGEPLGEIVYADTEGPFLIEVSQEAGPGVIDFSVGEDRLSATQREARSKSLREIFGTTSKMHVSEAWDAMEETGVPLGASPQFYYHKPDRSDRVYERVIKTETSTLPRDAAGNAITLSEVIHKE